MKYRYDGPAPIEVDDFGLVKPGDEHEFDSPPEWGPWSVVIEPKPDVPPPSTPPPPPPVTTPPPSTAASQPDTSSTEGK